MPSGLITDAKQLNYYPMLKVIIHNEHNLIESTTADDKGFYNFSM
jgi:hypothetical protein